jgi:hypothetical protein
MGPVHTINRVDLGGSETLLVNCVVWKSALRHLVFDRTLAFNVTAVFGARLMKQVAF